MVKEKIRNGHRYRTWIKILDYILLSFSLIFLLNFLYINGFNKSTNVTFSDNQKAKIKLSFKKKLGVSIQFSSEQIHNRKDKIQSINNQLEEERKIIHKKALDIEIGSEIKDKLQNIENVTTEHENKINLKITRDVF